MVNHEQNNYQSEPEALDPIACELGSMLYEKMRYSQFMSSRELEKLSTCHNLDELEKYFDGEKRILEAIYKRNPKLLSKSEFSYTFPLKQENREILLEIEQFVSVDYMRKIASQGDESKVKGVKVSVKKGKNGLSYISNVELTFKK